MFIGFFVDLVAQCTLNLEDCELISFGFELFAAQLKNYFVFSFFHYVSVNICT